LPGAPARRSVSFTFSYAESVGIKPKDWKINPSCSRLHLVAARSLNLETSLPCTRMTPDVGWSNPSRQLRSVVFPLPEWALRAMN
jgi:hypothetical protein